MSHKICFSFEKAAEDKLTEISHSGNLTLQVGDRDPYKLFKKTIDDQLR